MGQVLLMYRTREEKTYADQSSVICLDELTSAI